MAFKTKFLSVIAMAVLLVFLVLIQQQQQLQEASDYGSGHGQVFGEEPSPNILNRKVMNGVERKKLEALRKDVVHGWELRKVPSGPDPLHHNGGSPNKPRTP